MKYDKAYYEKLITQSPVFTLDKEIEVSAYRREALKLVEYLYCYLLGINQSKYEPFGYEITVVAKRCIQNFSPALGDFLHYFNAAWKKEYSHIYSEQTHEEKFQGIHITEEDKRNIRRYKKYLQSTGEHQSHEFTCAQIAEALSLPKEVVETVVEMTNINVGSTYQQNSDGEEYDVLDQLSDSSCIESKLETQESIEEILVSLDQGFLSLQDRQQPILSDLLTSRLLPVIEELDVDVQSFAFINVDIYTQYQSGIALPSQREIAQKYGRNEASVSRTLKQFIQKIQERM